LLKEENDFTDKHGSNTVHGSNGFETDNTDKKYPHESALDLYKSVNKYPCKSVLDPY